MTPREYLDAICRPNLQEFVLEPTSLRRAWAAATSLFHFADCLAVQRGTTVGPVRKAIVSLFPQFSALDDIANTAKHFDLDQKRHERVGLSADDFKIGRGAAFSDGSYYSDGTSHSDAHLVVRVEFQGEQIDVLNLCRTALEFLETRA